MPIHTCTHSYIYTCTHIHCAHIHCTHAHALMQPLAHTRITIHSYIMVMHAHIHMAAHIYSYVHAVIHPSTQITRNVYIHKLNQPYTCIHSELIPTRPCTHAPMHPYTHIPIHPYTHAPIHPCSHTHQASSLNLAAGGAYIVVGILRIVLMRRLTDVRVYANICICRQPQNKHTYAYKHAHTHTHTHTYAYTHAHTHTHTHTTIKARA